ncbi:MAG: nitrilase-related carbon-nitrogen hydrolase [Gammaproteobacteria bacterium]
MTQDRRNFLKSTALAGTAGLLTAALGPDGARAAMGKGADRHSMANDGSYAVVPLAKPAITLGVVQSRVRGVRIDNLAQDREANLVHMLDLIDNSFHFGGGADILFFHEFPITGYNTWNRKEVLQVAIEVPGPETERVAAKAKEHGCYVVFGSYVRDDDWPNHVLSITTIIGPDGEIVDKHWKARNIKGVFVGIELFTTTIYDVLDEYVERYGADAVLPVTRTPYGNLVTSSVQLEPELFRVFAMKGGEIFLRTATGGFTPWDMQATAGYNRVYCAVCNNAYSPENPGFFADAGSGGSAVYDSRGKIIAEADTKFETLVPARIPIAQFRATHRQPIVHMELYRDVFDTYRNAYAPNLFSEYQPTDLYDSKAYLKDKSRWK